MYSVIRMNDESCHTYEWVMLHLWTCCVTLISERYMCCVTHPSFELLYHPDIFRIVVSLLYLSICELLCYSYIFRIVRKCCVTQKFDSVVSLISARPYESCKIFKGRPRRNAFSKLVHRQYKSFPPDRFCQAEMKNPTRLSNKTSNAWSCAEDQILENKNLRNMIWISVLNDKLKLFRKSIYL